MSHTIVYNNFPWPTPTDAQRTRIEQTAQAILDARALYPDSSLADLYDELTMLHIITHRSFERVYIPHYIHRFRKNAHSSSLHLMASGVRMFRWNTWLS